VFGGRDGDPGNEEQEDKKMKEIMLSRGKVALVDEEDFDYINQWKWHYSDAGYAVRHPIGQNRKLLYMHREIINTPANMETDHINNNRLDNRRINLRICTHSENMHNGKIPIANTSGYKGVRMPKNSKKWEVRIKVNGKGIYLGVFKDVIEAAHVYDNAANVYHGKFAKTNFPKKGKK
jgi:hypothetical protein